jgi:hypothetical protein
MHHVPAGAAKLSRDATSILMDASESHARLCARQVRRPGFLIPVAIFATRATARIRFRESTTSRSPFLSRLAQQYASWLPPGETFDTSVGSLAAKILRFCANDTMRRWRHWTKRPGFFFNFDQRLDRPQPKDAFTPSELPSGQWRCARIMDVESLLRPVFRHWLEGWREDCRKVFY